MQNNLITIAAVIVLLISIVYFYNKYLFSYWSRHGVKSLKPSFPFGNFNLSLFRMRSMGEVLIDIYNNTTEPFIGIYGAYRPILLVRDTEIIRHILVKDFQHFTDHGVHWDEEYDPLSAHLFALPGQKWKNLRNKLSPAFSSGKLKGMLSSIISCGKSLEQHLDHVALTRGTMEVREVAAKYTTSVIASIAFGLDIDCLTEPNSEFRKYGKKALDPTVRNGLVFDFNFLFPSILKFLRIRSIYRDVENFFKSIVKQNLEYREQNNVTRKDFFQLLVQLRNTGVVQLDDQWETIIKNEDQKTLSLNQMTAHAYIFFLAGFETSSSTISFCMYELAKNPEIQQQVHEEIDAVLKKHSGEVTYDAVNEMKYLECCISETLRKYPVVPFLNRECTEEYYLPGTNVLIEKGIGVLISILGLHSDERYYEEPTKFFPDRFNEENSMGKNMVNRPYLPFGDGPRICIGMRLGILQAKIGLITMLRNHSYTLGDKHICEKLKYASSTFVLTPVSGIELKCHVRKQH